MVTTSVYKHICLPLFPLICPDCIDFLLIWMFLFSFPRYSMLSWIRSTTANLRTAPPQTSWRRCSRNSTACLTRPTRYMSLTGGKVLCMTLLSLLSRSQTGTFSFLLSSPASLWFYVFYSGTAAFKGLNPAFFLKPCYNNKAEVYFEWALPRGNIWNSPTRSFNEKKFPHFCSCGWGDEARKEKGTKNT